MTLHLHPADLVVLGLYLCIPLAIGVALRNRGSKDTGSFFLSGRSLPWWLAGTSMAADTFASDTPLYIAGIVRGGGIAANWEWWSFAFSGMLSVFVLARLWRRSEAVTDIAFVEFRYEGRSAAALRGIKAFLLAVPFNCIVLGGLPLLAMAKLLLVMGGVDPGDEAARGIAKLAAILVCLGVVLAYSTVSGLWAVVWNDFVLFWLALAGAVVLCGYAVSEVGGLAALREGILAADPPGMARLDFVPSPGTAAFSAFLVFMGVQWWAHRTVDGGGVNIQRMLACRNEGHAVAASLWFNVINYAVRTWPWILTGLAAVLLYPEIADREAAYPMAIRDLLPAGVRGFVVASIFAAFMTTADSQLNWGASYLVNDLYRRFVRSDAGEEHYLRVSRWSVLGLAAVTAVVAFAGTSVEQTFKFLISFSAGTGTVFLARWLWWRVNAWGELAAVLTAAAASVAWFLLTATSADRPVPLLDVPGHWRVPSGAAATILAWVTVTLATPPVSMARLVEFYRRTRPPGFWGPVRAASPDLPPSAPIARDLGHAAAGLALVLGAMLGTGKILLGEPGAGIAFLLAAAGGGIVLWRAYRDPAPPGAGPGV
ncbi:MAG: Na+:solute symporter [Planctomycetes bacterium]|nr:Na+:solute symporter [Planctomycetota bacterium]